VFPLLPAGPYRLEVEASGFRRSTVENIPNLTRNPLNLAFISPNASTSDYGREGYTATGSLTSFGGARFSDNELLLDGASLRHPYGYTGVNPNLEAISEVLININASSAAVPSASPQDPAQTASMERFGTTTGSPR
jgi:hypothetical protein